MRDHFCLSKRGADLTENSPYESKCQAKESSIPLFNKIDIMYFASSPKKSYLPSFYPNHQTSDQ
jgi:hypothetical protein